MAIVLLAGLAAILPRHADRARPLLREAGVVDDPGLDRFGEGHARQHQFAHPRQHGLVLPRRTSRQQYAAATGAAPRCVPVRSGLPAVPRSCGLRPTAARRSSHGTARPDRHGPARTSVPPHTPRTGLRCRHPREDPTVPPSEVRISTASRLPPISRQNIVLTTPELGRRFAILVGLTRNPVSFSRHFHRHGRACPGHRSWHSAAVLALCRY